MALVWRRGKVEINTDDGGSEAEARGVLPGESLVRVRYYWEIFRIRNPQIDPPSSGMAVMGVILLPNSLTPPGYNPISEPDQDWLDIHAQPSTFEMISLDFFTQRWPADPMERDIRVSRRNTSAEIEQVTFCWGIFGGQAETDMRVRIYMSLLVQTTP